MALSIEDPEYWRRANRSEVEAWASAATSASGAVNVRVLGLARAELVRRDGEYAEQQEQSRRDYEDRREADRRDFEIKRFELEGRRLSDQQEQQERLAKMQVEAAREAAAIQAEA